MAWTQAQLDAIEDSIAQGSLTVSFGAAGSSKNVTYRSLSEMLRIRDIIRRGLGLTNPRSTRIYPTFSKGTNESAGGSQAPEFDDFDMNDID